MTSIEQVPAGDKSAPYIELMIDDFDGYGGTTEITIRKYPSRIFVAYSHDSGLYQGDDNMDVFIAPSYITEKTPHAQFNLLKAFEKVCAILYKENPDMAQYYFEIYSPAWNYIMQGNVKSAIKALPEDER